MCDESTENQHNPDDGKIISCGSVRELQNVKRVRWRQTGAESELHTPTPLIYRRVEDDHMVWTVRENAESVARLVAAQLGRENVTVERLTLEEIFKDFIRGQRGS